MITGVDLNHSDSIGDHPNAGVNKRREIINSNREDDIDTVEQSQGLLCIWKKRTGVQRMTGGKNEQRVQWFGVNPRGNHFSKLRKFR